MTIQEIKTYIKNDTRIGFHTVGIDDVMFIEKLLLDNNMVWRGRRKNESIFNERGGVSHIFIYINYDLNEPKKMAYGSSASPLPVSTVEVSNYTRYQLKSVFRNEPSYKPKRIKRII